MTFSSIIFICYFLPFFLLIYFSVPKDFKNWVLLFFSIFFYFWGAPSFLFVILCVTIVDFFIVKRISKTKGKIKLLFLWLSLVLNIGILIYFKYFNFFIDNINILLDYLGYNSIYWVSAILPIGLSFYTFQTLTYSIDVYRGIHQPMRRLEDYAIFIFSFPHLVAGPIIKYSLIADQIKERSFFIDDQLIGFYRFSLGLAKKVLIANTLSESVDVIFLTNPNDISSYHAWIGTLGFTFQIYFDFSGYSDMAIGLARMLGFTFPENFNSPYVAKNFTQFWKRWHITLGNFMHEYLYVPLGGNRTNRGYRIYVNLIIVFLISGLWHGASWNFLLWGAYHGVLIVIDKAIFKKSQIILNNYISIFLTFLFVSFGWILFKIVNFNTLKDFIFRLFSGNFVDEIRISNSFYFTLLIAFFFSFFTLSKIGRNFENFFYGNNSFKLKHHMFLSLLSMFMLLVSFIFLTSSSFNPFIYFRF